MAIEERGAAPLGESSRGAIGRAAECVRGFDARYLGLAALPAVFENFRRVSFPTSAAAAQAADPMALVLAYALALAAACALALRRGLSGAGRMPAGPLAAARLAMALALIPLGVFANRSAACAFALFADAGTVCALGLIGWMGALAAAPARLLVAYCSAGVILGKALRGLFVADPGLGAGEASVAVGLCAAVSMALLAWLEKRPSHDADHMAGRAKSPAADSPAEHVPLSESLRISLNVAAVGYAVTWFTKGVLAVPPPELIGEHSVWMPVVSAVACAVALAAVFAPGGKPLRLAAALDRAHFMAPFMATSMIYFCFIRMTSATGALKTALSLVGDWGSLFFATLFLYIGALSCSERGISPAVQSTPTMLLAMAAYVGGTLCYAWIGNYAMYIQVTVITLYLLGITVGLVQRATTGEEARRLERVGKLSEHWGLSAREAEVLQLMADGHSNDAIAAELVISPETVRTHQKRIYVKAGVHKREELLRALREGS